MKIKFFIFLIFLLGFSFNFKPGFFAMEKQTTPKNSTATAIFAGGCFWCMEPPFEKLKGVIKVIAGYTGGSKENPTYAEVTSGKTGHVEAIQIIYDPSQINYSQLLEVFWQNIDPTDDGGQFVDRGFQYKPAIFYENEEQHVLAEESKKQLEVSGRFNKPILTEIHPFRKFYPAEDYHQDYYKKNVLHYKMYRHGSGRDQFLEKSWKNSPQK